MKISLEEKVMDSKVTRAKYEAPKLEVQRLRDLPSALATSSHGSSFDSQASAGHHGSHK